MSDSPPLSCTHSNTPKERLAKFINNLIGSVRLLQIPHLDGSTVRMITKVVEEVGAPDDQERFTNDNLEVEGAWSRFWSLAWMYLVGGGLCGLIVHLIAKDVNTLEHSAGLMGGVLGCAAVSFTLHCARTKKSYRKGTGLLVGSATFTLLFIGFLFFIENGFNTDRDTWLLVPLSLSFFIIATILQVVAVLPAWLMYRELDAYLTHHNQ